MRRLYFLVPDAEICQNIVDELEEYGIPEHDIHLVGSDGATIQHVNPATVVQTSDIVPGLVGGILVGGVAGLLSGFLAVYHSPVSLDLGEHALFWTTLGGAAFGALVSGMVAKDMPNKALRDYERAILAGWFLLIADVPKKRLEDTISMIRGHHSEADIRIATPKEPALLRGRSK